MFCYSSSRKLYQMQLVKSGTASCFWRFIKQFTRVKSEKSWPKNSVCVCVCARTRACILSHIWLFGKSWTVDHQSPLSMGLPRQDYYWSRLPFPTPEDLPDSGIEPSFLESPAFAGRFFFFFFHHWYHLGSPQEGRIISTFNPVFPKHLTLKTFLPT